MTFDFTRDDIRPESLTNDPTADNHETCRSRDEPTRSFPAGNDAPRSRQVDRSVFRLVSEVREPLSRFRIVNVSKHPIQCAIRDLLGASLFRDPRAKWFRQLASRRPQLLLDMVEHLPPGSRDQAIQLLALAAVHQRTLRRLLDEERKWAQEEGNEVDAQDPNNIKRTLFLDRIAGCRPCGAKFVSNGSPTAYPRCGYPKICPWCFGRLVQEIYTALIGGPLEQADHQTYLGILSVEFGNQGLPSVQRQSTYDLMSEALEQPTVDSIGWGDFSRHQFLCPQQVREVRRTVGDWLVRHARDQGADGGLLIHQISSDRSELPELGFRHEIKVLFSVRAAGVHLQRLCNGMRTTRSITGINDWSITPSWLLVPAAHSKALRFCMMGSSTSYPVSRLNILSETDASDQGLLRRGFRGAFQLNPTYLMTPIQWWSYAQATKGLRLYSAFGSWIDHLAMGRAIVSRARRRVETLQTSVNLPRRLAAAERLHGLELLALSLCRNQRERSDLRRLGWRQLQRRLAEQGHSISDWTARKLSERLRNRIDD
jgi:hypothetical protein